MHTDAGSNDVNVNRVLFGFYFFWAGDNIPYAEKYKSPVIGRSTLFYMSNAKKVTIYLLLRDCVLTL